MAALDEARRIHFFASPLYLSLIAVMLTTTLAALACLSRRSALVQGRAAILFVLAFAFAALDYVNNVSLHYSFGSTFGRDKPVDSAAEVSGFNLAAGAHGNNVVVVIVESLGYLLPGRPRAHRRAAVRSGRHQRLCRYFRSHCLLRLHHLRRDA